MINKLKVGYFVISSRCLEITFHLFGVGKKACDFVEVRKKVTVQRLEEVEKKPAGFF